RCAIIIPLVHDGRACGTLNVSRRQEGFDPLEVVFLETVAVFIAQIYRRLMALNVGVRRVVHRELISLMQRLTDRLSELEENGSGKASGALLRLGAFLGADPKEMAGAMRLMAFARQDDDDEEEH